MKPTLYYLFSVSLLAGCFCNVVNCADTPPDRALGSTAFQPSAESPVGWRGDGSGRYPGAKPPVAWERTQHEKSYETKGIAWMVPLPNIGVSCPVIVGNQIFLTTEVADLVCLDKQTGTIQWIRSNSEFEGLSAEERKANPACAEKLDPLAEKLTQANLDLVKELNARMATAATAPTPPPSPVITRKREIEKAILDEQLAIDKKDFGRYWGQAIFGFSGPTPVSDGKNIFVFFTTGVSACYSLTGERKWITRGSGKGSEHGNFASPILWANQFVVWGNELRSYDADTGKLKWSLPAKANNSYGSCIRLKSGDDWVVGFQSGFFARLSDGKPVWGNNIFGDNVPTPIIENNTIYTWVGYPRASEKLGFKAYPIPASIEVPKLVPAYMFKMDWAEDEIPVDKQKNPFDRNYVSSPLLFDGLMYQITQGGGLFVNDAATGELVYKKVLPLKPRTQYWDWAGVSASPTLAGKLIYVMDNQGTTLVLQPGREYKEMGRNLIQESRDGQHQVQNCSTPIFEGTRMYYRTPGYLYCVGDN